MFSTLRTRFGIPGVISVMALVFAMFGGAYAASNSSDAGKATASAKAKKGPRGPKGAKGDTGSAGPAGPAGAQGPKGDVGAAGSNGASGVSPTGTAFSGTKAGSGCSEGGVEFQGANTTYACNGKKGANGQPWVPNNTLPSEASETGIWGTDGPVQFDESKAGPITLSISFPIPLADAPVPVFLNEGESSKAGCSGVVDGIPTAEPGFLCVYTDALEGVSLQTFPGGEPGFLYPATPMECGGFGCFKPGAAPIGTLLAINCESGGCYAGGKWAVTAE